MARLEVHVRKDDVALIRNVIRALANPDQEQATRALLAQTPSSKGSPPGGALRAAPLITFS